MQKDLTFLNPSMLDAIPFVRPERGMVYGNGKDGSSLQLPISFWLNWDNVAGSELSYPRFPRSREP